MPYEATVPVHRRLLWPAVTDAERLIGALPNASIDASGAQGVAGRLRVRTRGQTVTFRGVARIVEVVPASLRVSLEVEAVFGRAGGTVEGVVEIALRQAGSGTRVTVGGQLDLAPGAASLSVEALDSAFKRIVERWFTALAETSPAKKRSPADRDEPVAERTERQAGERLPSRAAERAPLAVVRDPATESGAKDPAADVPQAAAAPESPEPDGEFSQPADGTQAGTGAGTQDPDTAAIEIAHAPASLRLVTPEPDAADEDDQSPVHLPADDSAFGLSPEEPADPAEPEPDDIWSRLRDRSLPPWIPFVVGAATATLATIAFVLAALRRRYRR